MRIQDTFLDAKHLESCFPGRRITYTNVAAGAVPVPPFRVTFPELQPEAIAAAASKQATGDGAAPPEDASLEPLRVEVRFVCARHTLRRPGLARDDTLCSDALSAAENTH